MDYLPLFMRLQSAQTVVIGGGGVAARKVRLLKAAGAQVKVIALALCSELEAESTQAYCTFFQKAFSPEDLDGAVLVIAATNQKAVNEAVASEAKKRHLPVNVVDQPALCSFILPSIVDRSPLMVAVSSGGDAPVLARQIRTQLEGFLPHKLGRLAKIAGEYRQTLKQTLPDPDARRRFWENVFEGRIGESILSGHEAEGRALLEASLQSGEIPKTGAVYLVGSGPGNPDLLTFRALKLMQQAEVVLYDHLVSPDILELTRRDAERICVGKRANKHTLPQEAINETLIQWALAGKRVLRLKGGDPFIFGRGGEEMASLMAHGIPFEIVPGITSASGASTYAGIPLTHRDHAQSVTFVTGHRRAGEASLNLDWPALARPQQTVVIYMGLGELKSIVEALIAHGRAASTPIALIERATTPQQKTVISTLEGIQEASDKAQLASPTLMIIGEVVQLHSQLEWYAAHLLDEDKK